MSEQIVHKKLDELLALNKELARVVRNGYVGRKVGRRIQEKKQELKELGVIV